MTAVFLGSNRSCPVTAGPVPRVPLLLVTAQVAPPEHASRLAHEAAGLLVRYARAAGRAATRPGCCWAPAARRRPCPGS